MKTAKRRLQEVRWGLLGRRDYDQQKLDKLGISEVNAGVKVGYSDSTPEYWDDVMMMTDVVDAFGEYALLRVTWCIDEGLSREDAYISEITWLPAHEGVKLSKVAELEKEFGNVTEVNGVVVLEPDDLWKKAFHKQFDEMAWRKVDFIALKPENSTEFARILMRAIDAGYMVIGKIDEETLNGEDFTKNASLRLLNMERECYRSRFRVEEPSEPFGDSKKMFVLKLKGIREEW